VTIAVISIDLTLLPNAQIWDDVEIITSSAAVFSSRFKDQVEWVGSGNGQYSISLGSSHKLPSWNEEGDELPCR
jgi:hypothetical protein